MPPIRVNQPASEAVEGFDVIMPEGPLLMVHKGWNATSPISSPASQEKLVLNRQMQDHVPGQGQQFSFVHSTKPGRHKDSEVRKLVRTHVRNEHIRQEQLAKRKVKKKKERSLQSNQVAGQASAGSQLSDKFHPWYPDDLFSIPRLLGQPTALVLDGYAIEMQPRTHVLLNRYMRSVSQKNFPVENLLNNSCLRTPGYFQLAVADAAMLHALLYSASLHVSLLDGIQESTDGIYHKGEALMLIQQRLSEGTAHLDDSTLAATSCLAFGEAVSGNENLWRLHMRGLKQMIDIKGGAKLLSPLMRNKVRRSDLQGAIDYASTSYLDLPLDLPLPPQVWTQLSPSQLEATKASTTQLLTPAGVHPHLIVIMTDVAFFLQMIHFARERRLARMEFSEFSDSLCSIESALVSFPSTLQPISTGGPSLSSGQWAKGERPIDNACRLGSLLCLKAILQEFPHSVTGFTVLLSSLRTSLSSLLSPSPTQPSPTLTGPQTPLLIWLYFIGANLAKGDLRNWFRDYLKTMALLGNLEEGGDGMAICRLFGIRQVFGRGFEEVWKGLGTFR